MDVCPNHDSSSVSVTVIEERHKSEQNFPPATRLENNTLVNGSRYRAKLQV